MSSQGNKYEYQGDDGQYYYNSNWASFADMANDPGFQNSPEGRTYWADQRAKEAAAAEAQRQGTYNAAHDQTLNTLLTSPGRQATILTNPVNPGLKKTPNFNPTSIL